MDLSSMFGKMQEMQQRMAEVRSKLSEMTTTGEAGGGMVKVTVNGMRQVRKVQIDKEAIQDPEMMEDLIVAATNAALDKAELMAKEEMGKVTSGMLPNIPGLDLSQFGM